MIGAYIAKHPSGVFYVGQTGNIVNRKRQHLRELELGTHHSAKLQEAFNSDSRLEWEFIETTDKAEAIALEDYYLKINSNNPLICNNYGVTFINPRVDGYTGVKQSEATVAKRAASLRGLKRSEQSIRNLSESHLNSDKCKRHMDHLHETAKRGVIVDDVIYPSVKDTAQAYNIHSATVIQRINSKTERFSGWIYQ